MEPKIKIFLKQSFTTISINKLFSNYPLTAQKSRSCVPEYYSQSRYYYTALLLL